MKIDRRTAWLLVCLLPAACAAPPDASKPAEAAANAPPPVPTTEPGDDALTCPAISSQIGEMNARVDQANQRTRALASSGTTGGGTSIANGGGPGVPSFNVNANNNPGLGPNGFGIDGGAAGNTDAMDAQQKFANSAIARANHMIALGRSKKCFA